MQVKDCVLIEAFKCNEEESVVDVAKKLREYTLRHIFVVNDEDYPVGLISVTDINNRIVAEGKNPNELKEKDIMTKPVDVIDESDDIKEVYKTMLEKNRVMNPVVKDKKIVGMITIHQLIKNIGVKQNETK